MKFNICLIDSQNGELLKYLWLLDFKIQDKLIL